MARAYLRDLGVFRCEYCAVFRPDLPIRVSTAPARPIEVLLAEWRDFGILPAKTLRVHGAPSWMLDAAAGRSQPAAATR